MFTDHENTINVIAAMLARECGNAAQALVEAGEFRQKVTRASVAAGGYAGELANIAEEYAAQRLRQAGGALEAAAIKCVRRYGWSAEDVLAAASAFESMARALDNAAEDGYAGACYLRLQAARASAMRKAADAAWTDAEWRASHEADTDADAKRRPTPAIKRQPTDGRTACARYPD